MTTFATTRRPHAPTTVAPDGSDVRVLLALPRGSMAEFELAAGRVSAAVTHRTVEEMWYVQQGRGEMWRRQGAREEVVLLEPGVCLTIPQGTHFQFKALDSLREPKLHGPKPDDGGRSSHTGRAAAGAAGAGLLFILG